MECPQCIKKKKKIRTYNNDEQRILFMHINSSNKDFFKMAKNESSNEVGEMCVLCVGNCPKKHKEKEGEKNGMKLTFIQMFLFFIFFLLIAPCQIYSEALFFSTSFSRRSSSSSLSTYTYI